MPPEQSQETTETTATTSTATTDGKAQTETKTAEGSKTETTTATTKAAVEPPKFDPKEVEAWKASHDKLAALSAKVPLNAGDYALDVADDVAWGDGTKFAFDKDSELAIQGREWAKKNGLSGEAFKEALSLVGRTFIDMTRRAEEMQVAEGEKAMARLALPSVPEADRVADGVRRAERVEKWLDDHKMGDLKDTIRTPEAVVAMERLIEKAGGPRSGPAPSTGAVDKPWTEMSGKELRAQGWAERRRA